MGCRKSLSFIVQRQILVLALGISGPIPAAQSRNTHLCRGCCRAQREGASEWLCIFSNYISRAPYSEISNVKQQEFLPGTQQGDPKKSSLHREAK